MSLNRRSFIRAASLAAAGNAAGLRPFGALNSLAATTPDYKALVCIFMYGGNDSNNTLVPFNTKANQAYEGTHTGPTGGAYTAYSSIRGPLALPENQLIPLGASVNGNFGLHPSLGSLTNPNAPNIQNLFNNNKLAFVANVGTLVKHLTPAQFQAGALPVPVNLFSHPDQQLEWQNAQQSSAVSVGWAGQIADLMGGSYNPSATVPLITSVYGDTVFCNGRSSSPVAVDAGSLGAGKCSEVSQAVCNSREGTAQQLVRLPSGLSLVTSDNAITTDAYKYMANLTAAVQSVAPIETPFPANNSLAVQLQQIAQIIKARNALGVTRQIFFAGLGNFDTHANQLATQAGLLSLLGPAMYAFYESTVELGLEEAVTTFTMSDFSRALQPNSNFGSDHAWGGHHMVMGGAVQGGAIYGRYPTLQLQGPNDSGLNGRWIPTTSSSVYAATLASWFGVPGDGSEGTALASIFPNLPNFATKSLAFL